MQEKEELIKLKDELQISFGKRVVKLREAKDVTAAELARRCDMERSNIARLEGGRTNPTLFVMKKICLALDVPLTDLINGL